MLNYFLEQPYVIAKFILLLFYKLFQEVYCRVIYLGMFERCKFESPLLRLRSLHHRRQVRDCYTGEFWLEILLHKLLYMLSKTPMLPSCQLKIEVN